VRLGHEDDARNDTAERFPKGRGAAEDLWLLGVSINLAIGDESAADRPRLSLKGSLRLACGSGVGWVVRSGSAGFRGVVCVGAVLGRLGGEVVAVDLGEVVGHHQ
jgi:hypothetical protein